MRLRNKVAIITGGASGIGRETALLFSREGAKVVVADNNQAGGLQTISEVKEIGDGLFVITDVSNRHQIKQLIDETIAKYGKIDVLINNAGIAQDALFSKMTTEQWDRVIEINLKGTFNCIQSVISIMINQGHGVIINASSVVGLFGNIGQVNYAAAKAGIIGMTKALAKELGKKGIRVNALAPGFTMTPMLANVPQNILEVIKEKTPLKRLGEPKDIANAYLFLASDEAAFINGAILCVDGGLTL